MTRSPVKPAVSFLYKYSSAEHLDWLETILFRHELYFPNPNQLNDPKDARPDLSRASREALTAFLVDDFLSRNRYESMATLAAGVARTLVAVPAFGTDALLRELSKHFNQEMERHRIYSLTTRPDNEHLWTRYAHSHTGYCLEFHNEGLFALALQVQYVESMELDATDAAQFDAAFLFQKTKRWSQEEEVRIVLFPRGRPAVVPFAPHLLRRIILGRSMSAENRELIRAWALLRSPEVTVADEGDESGEAQAVERSTSATVLNSSQMCNDEPKVAAALGSGPITSGSIMGGFRMHSLASYWWRR